MSITIQKSASGAYFTILDSQDNLLRPFMVNDYDFIPDIDGVSFSLEARCCKSPDRFKIIDKVPYTSVINGDTSAVFANFAALQTYVLTNFFRNAGGSTGAATWGLITGTLSAQTDLAAVLAGKASGLAPTAVKTANYTAAASDLVPVDTTAGGVTITLPTAPADGARIGIKHVIQGGTNVVSLALGGSDVFNKAGGATTGNMILLNQGITLQYKATGAIWYVVSDDLPLSQLDLRYSPLAGGSSITTVGTLAAGSIPYSLVTGGPSFNSPAITGQATFNAVSDATKSITWMGDSIMVGFNLSNVANRYPTQVSNALGYVENNLAVSGTTVGGTSTTLIPTYSAGTTAYLVIGFGTNDRATRTAPQFQSDLTTFVNAALSKGWPSTSIYIQSTPGFQYQSGVNDTRDKSYNTAMATVATNLSCNFIDVYTPMIATAPFGPVTNTYMSADGTHPNDLYGSYALYALLVTNFPDKFNITTQSLVSSGTTELSTLKLRQFNYSTSGNFVVADRNGNLGIASGIPNETRTLGILRVAGQVLQDAALTLPTGVGAYDMVLNQNAKIYSQNSSANYGYLNLFDGSTFTTLYNSYATGAIKFNVSGGTTGNTLLALTILGTGNIQMPFGATYFEQSAGSNQGRLQLFDGSGNTNFWNSYGTGFYRHYMSGGVNGTQTLMYQMFPSGRAIYQNGGTFTDDTVNILQLSGSQAINKNAILAVSTDGLTIANNASSLASGGNTIQTSPRLRFVAHSWNTTATAADNISDWIMEVRPTSGASPTSKIYIASRQSVLGTGSFTDQINIDTNGSLTAGQLLATTYFGGIQSNSASLLLSNFYTSAGGGNNLSSASIGFGGTNNIGLRVFAGMGNTSLSLTSGNNYAAFLIGNSTVTTASASTTAWAVSQVINPLGTVTLGGGGATLTNTASLYVNGASAAGASNYAVYIASGNVNIQGLTASKLVFTDASKNLTSTGIGTTSQFIAGDGSLVTIGQRPHTISTPTTGGTVALTNNQYNIINPAGTLVALTVNLPSSPANNDCVFIKYTQSVTTVTYGNGTVVDGITAPTAGGLVVLVYDSGTTSWY